MEPADRISRLLAAIADACPLLLLIAVHEHARMRESFGLALLAIGLFVALGCVQLWLLTARGQTLGKLALGIRVVRTKDMANGGFVVNVLWRVTAGTLLAMLPYVGALYYVADILFIFRSDRRCLHDLIAGTVVVEG